MASIDDLWMDGRRKLPAYGKGKRWQVRWRDADERQCKRRFRTKDEAVAFQAQQELSPESARSSVTVAELWPAWIATKARRKETTRVDYLQQWRLRVEPAFGHRAVASLTYTEIQTWHAGIAAEKSASVANRSLVVLRGIIDLARRDKIITEDPTYRLKQERPERREARFLTIDEVERLAAECHPYELVVWTLAMTGIRFGEMCGLQVEDLDVERRRLRVSRSITMAGGKTIVSSPKSGRARDVPAPGWLCEELAEQAGESGPLLRSATGGAWSQSSWRRVWRTHTVVRGGKQVKVPGAIERAGLAPLRVHDLRHTAASLAIAAGANVSVVQRMLGHASAVMTMDLYRHLWDSELDDIADRMGRLRSG